MSEKKLSGFAALMKMRRQEKDKQEGEEQELKPVIKEISLSSIEEKIRQLEQQMEDSENDHFVDVDSDSSEESSDEREKITQSKTQSIKSQKKWEEKQREQKLLEKMKKANEENQGSVELTETEAYCEACNLKLSGDMNISTHIESSGHLTRLKVIFKNDLYSSSHSKNVCTTCCVSFGSPDLLVKHREYRGHSGNARLKQRLCYCKLCRKQFTSGFQLAEHLKGKAHKERLLKMMDNQHKMKQSRGQRFYVIC